MIEVICILAAIMCLLILIETAFCDKDVPDDIVKKK